jgi:hypothetical protein
MGFAIRPSAVVGLAAILLVCGSFACGAASALWPEDVPGESVGGEDGGLDQYSPPDASGGIDSPTLIDGFYSDNDFYEGAYEDGEYAEGGYNEAGYYDGEYTEGGYYDSEFYDGYPSDAPYADVVPVDSGPSWDGGSAIVIATSEQPANLALDSTYVYWENSTGSVVNCPLAGCPDNIPSILSINGGGNASYQTLGVGAGTSFFLDPSSNIDSCAGGGCGNSPTVYEEADDAGYGFYQLVTDTANVYFTDTISIFSCPLGSTCDSPKTLATSTGAELGPLYSTGNTVFFADDGTVTQSIRAVPIEGGKAPRICTSPLLGDVESLVVSGGYVYFTTADDVSSIYQCPMGGGSPEVYASDESPLSLATDGVSLYWTNYVGNGNVVTCALGSTCSDPRTVAASQDSPYAIAVNSSDVYWTTTSAIYRAAK